jgi:hypothetical protein
MDINVISLWLTEVEQHGITLVLLMMILFLWFIPWVKQMQRAAAIKNDEKEDSLALQVKYEAEVNRILGALSDKLKCQWAVLWQFHNGTATIGGVPFLKTSVTNEVTDPEYAPRGDLYQQIPVSVFIDAIIKIKEDGYLTIGVNDKNYLPIVNSYKRDGVQRGYFVRVDDIHGRMVGILSVSFAVDNLGLFDRQVEDLKNYASRISMALAQIAAVTPPQHRRKDDE